MGNKMTRDQRLALRYEGKESATDKKRRIEAEREASRKKRPVAEASRGRGSRQEASGSTSRTVGRSQGQTLMDVARQIQDTEASAKRRSSHHRTGVAESVRKALRKF